MFNYFVAFLHWKTAHCLKFLVMLEMRDCWQWHYFRAVLLPQEDHKMFSNYQRACVHIWFKIPSLRFYKHLHKFHFYVADTESPWTEKPFFPLKCTKKNPTLSRQNYNCLASSSREPSSLGALPCASGRADFLNYDQEREMILFCGDSPFLICAIALQWSQTWFFSTAWIHVKRNLWIKVYSHPAISHSFRISFHQVNALGCL